MQINILEYFERGAALHCPNNTAIIDEQRSYTFSEVECYAKRCAGLLIARLNGIRQPITVYLPRTAAVIFADLGIIYSGNFYSNLDVKSPSQRVYAVIRNISPALIVTSRELAAHLVEMGVNDSQLFFIEDIFSDAEIPDKAFLWKRLDEVIDTDPLCIINTSGSTGIPKSVVLNHRSTIDFMDWCFDRLKLDGSERIGSLSPFYFDIYTLELVLCIAKGATIVIIPDQMSVFPMKLIQYLERQAVSFIFWVPSIMVNISNQGLLEQADLSAIKTIFFAGEVFPTKHLNHWRRVLPGAKFVNLYGPIEITVDCTYYIVERDFADDEALPIGFPCRNTDVLILNEQNQPCRPGEHGELCVRGSSLAMGYWNDPEKTAKAFTQNPLNTHYPEVIYRTGDLVYRNVRDEIMFVGRKDFQIKHLGYRIELPEIEFQVLTMDEIANACVLYNKQAKEITLCYQGKGGGVTPAAIRQHLSKSLPKYMLPTAFHEMPELPRNPNGKIDRNALAEQLQQMTM